MLSLFLSESADNSAANPSSNWGYYVFFAVIIVLLVVWLVWSSRSNKKKQKEAQDLINAVKPGNKVKTIGGVCGIVVEVNEEENTFVLETGSETSGKCYMKFDKQAIYQTDAETPKTDKSAKEEKAEPVLAEASEPLPAEAPAEAPAEKTEE